MKESDETRITRWMDGELSDEEIRDLLDADPELVEQKRAARKTGQLLRSALPTIEGIPHEDLFNNQVQDRIHDEAAEELNRSESELFPRFTLFRKLAGWGIAAGLVFYIALAMGLFHSAAGADLSIVERNYTPDPNLETVTTLDEDAEVTIIRIQGLEPVETTEEIVGFFPTCHESNAVIGATTFSTEGAPIFILSALTGFEPQHHEFNR